MIYNLQNPFLDLEMGDGIRGEGGGIGGGGYWGGGAL